VRYASVLVLAFCSVAGAQPRAIWEGNNLGSAREISIALTPDRVFLSEAYTITTVDRTTGTATVFAMELPEYQPVQDSVFADGVLWLSLGYDAAHTVRRLATFDGQRITERTRVHAPACSLAWSGNALLWVDQDGEHIHRVGRTGAAAIVARAPNGRHFVSDCRTPLAIDETHAYLTLAYQDPARIPALVRVRLNDGAIEQLDPGARLEFVYGVSQGVLVLGHQTTIDRFDLATRTRTALATDAAWVMIATIQDGDVVWIDGNLFAGHDWSLRRVPIGGGPSRTVHRGDPRLAYDLVADGGSVLALVGAHPPGECTQRWEGCGQGGELVTRCPTADYRLFELR
jgi:hypothetical protein